MLEFQKNNLAGALGFEGLKTLAEGMRAEAFGALMGVRQDVSELLGLEGFQNAVANGLVHGAASLGDLTDLTMQQLAAVGIPSLEIDTDAWAKAGGKAKSEYATRKYETKETLQAIQNNAGEAAAEAQNWVQVRVDDGMGEGTRRTGRTRGTGGVAENGTVRRSNGVRSATLDFGDGRPLQSIAVGSDVDVENGYTEAGYYVATLRVEREGLSLPPQSMLVQVQDLDVADEDFPTAEKAFMAALADAMGVQGPSLAGGDVWQAYNGDQVPAGLKMFAGLNPLDWNTSGDGIDDDWALKMGLDPRIENADNDQDGDGLTAWQEYQGEGPKEGGVHSVARTRTL